MTNPIQWTSRSGESRLDFHVKTDNGQMKVYAELFQKNVNNQFNSTQIFIDERNMVVERENLHALMRGIPQQISYVSQLNNEQKNALIHSLQSRNITIENWINAGKITIHALP